VDDINDSGATLNWIKKDWRSSCGPADPKWDTVWHNTVKFATLIDNLASDAKVDYSATEVNKAEHDVWMVFPWEEWWKTPASN
jgi:hypoxanthine phosphoribosyltransferase